MVPRICSLPLDNQSISHHDKSDLSYDLSYNDSKISQDLSSFAFLSIKRPVIYELKEKRSHFMSIFKERLRYCRARSGKTQEEVAKETSIAYSTYRRYERGGTQPTLDDAARIADFFDVSLDYLAGRSDEP